MKKINLRSIKFLLVVVVASMMLSSCATILGGRIDNCQSTPPRNSGKPRQIRVGWLILDVICGLIPVGVDFLTTAIYKPCTPR